MIKAYSLTDTKIRKCFVDGDVCILRAEGKRFDTKIINK